MWDSERLEKVANALLPCVSAAIHVELLNGLNSYGLDHGGALLTTFGILFQKPFMRQFYTGNGRQFSDAWDNLQDEIDAQPRNWRLQQS